MKNSDEKTCRRSWRRALTACILALFATGAIGAAIVLRVNAKIGSEADMVGGCIQFNQRVEVLAVDAREETMRVRVLPWDDGTTVSAGTLAAGEEGTVDYSKACMGSLAPLPGDDLVVSWIGLVNDESSFPLAVDVVNTTLAFRNETNSFSASEQSGVHGDRKIQQTSPTKDEKTADSPSSNASDSELEAGGVFACDVAVEVTGLDAASDTAYVRTLPAGQTDLDGEPLSIPAGAEGAIRLSAANWRYGHAPKAGDCLIVSWIGTKPELPESPSSIRTAGDFWYETGRPWPDAWIEASSSGALTRQMVATTPLDELLKAEERRADMHATAE